MYNHIHIVYQHLSYRCVTNNDHDITHTSREGSGPEVQAIGFSSITYNDNASITPTNDDKYY